MRITYNPILEVNDLRRFRVSSIPAPKLGTALVLDPANGAPFVVMPGEQVPDPRLGRYRRSWVIDLAAYGLRLEEQLPSRDPAFRFAATIQFACNVIDPVQIAMNNVWDMALSVRTLLVKTMRGVAQQYDVLEFNLAEAALNATLDRQHGNSAVRLGNFLVEFDSGPNSEIHNVLRDSRLDGIRRDDMAEVVRGGRDALIAQWLAKHGGDPSAMFEHEAALEALKNEQLLELHRISVAGDKTEAFEVRRDRDRIVDRFLGGSSALSGDGGHKRSRLAGTLASGRSERADRSTPAADPDQPVTAEQLPVDGTGPGRGARPSTSDNSGMSMPAEGSEPVRSSRVRGSGRRRSADPDAEA